MSTPCAGCNKALASHQITIGVREGFGFPCTSSYELQFALCVGCASGLVTSSTPEAVRRSRPNPFTRPGGPGGRPNGQKPAPKGVVEAPAAPAGAGAGGSAVVVSKKK